jgi:predicted O-methyltransferase YrrM
MPTFRRITIVVTRAWAAWRELVALARLPPRVTRFYVRALLTALAARDRFALVASARPRELRTLLELARGANRVVELGTGTAWTAIAFALADPQRTVATYDPREFEQRQRYLAMVPSHVRQRIDLRPERGDVRGSGAPVDLLFIDIGAHTKEQTVDAYNAWAALVAPGGTIAFHDYSDAWPGVREAVESLGLTGALAGVLFVTRKDDTSG